MDGIFLHPFAILRCFFKRFEFWTLIQEISYIFFPFEAFIYV